MSGALDVVEIYRSRRKWRWRYKDGGNHKTMANGGEGYNHLGDIVGSITAVLGLTPFHLVGVSFERVPRQGGASEVLVVVIR